MKIAAVESFAYAVPVRSPGPETGWYRRLSTQVLVRVRTEDGAEGWGEAFAYGAPLAVAELVRTVFAPAVIGHDPRHIPALNDRMQRAGRIAGRTGLAMFALSAVEIALWDLAGRIAGLPVYQLLGGAARSELPAYASHPHYESPGDVALGCEASVTAGFRRLKLHQVDPDSVRVAREVIGPHVALMLDTNNAWDLAGALAMAKACEPFNLTWLEEPIWPPEDYRALAAVRARATMPIALGENEFTLTGFREILAAGAADVLQPSVTKCGGISALRDVATLARAANVTLIPHSFYFGPGLAATVHAAATFAGDSPIEFPLGELEVPLLSAPLTAQAGMVRVPEGPGLGVEVNVVALEPYRIR